MCRLGVAACSFLLFAASGLQAQRPAPPPLPKPTPGPPTRPGTEPSTVPMLVTLTISIRDTSGNPLDSSGIVTIHGGPDNAFRTAVTQSASGAVFSGVGQGEYEAEIKCVGYQTTTERLSVSDMGTMQEVYIYLRRESEVKSASVRPGGTVMSPKLRAEINKGLDALRLRHYDVAHAHFEKGVQLAPGNPDVVYLLGVSELGLGHRHQAQQDFEHALSLEPGHERALIALGELQLESGNTSEAITTLEKAYQVNGAGWLTHYLLVVAYQKSGRFSDAETHALRAVALAHGKAAGVLLLLGEIQREEGKLDEARKTWQKLLTDFPASTLARRAKEDLDALADPKPAASEAVLTALPVHALPNLDLAPPAERPWAPLDVDSREYSLAQDVPCQLEDILGHAARRLKSQMRNFEKFTATEHIEHQEIDRYGRLGAVRTRDFSYIVFVHLYQGDSFYLEEERRAFGPDESLLNSLATMGLNNLGVAVLQPAESDTLSFRCEGLSNARETAAWQIHFEEKKEVQEGMRAWRRDGKLYHIPLKGRLWISSASYDLLRIETDLREPVEAVGLTRDHLTVDYGPVNFRSSTTSLWLPWSAEVYIELHGRRYHQRHCLADYLLFEVDTNHKIN